MSASDVRKNLFGAYHVYYVCQKCGDRLSSPIDDAGAKDKCPSCETSFVVPGSKDRERLFEEDLQRKQLAKQALHYEAKANRERSWLAPRPASWLETLFTAFVLLVVGGPIVGLMVLFLMIGGPGAYEHFFGDQPHYDYSSNRQIEDDKATVRILERQRLEGSLRDPSSLQIIDERVETLPNGKFRYHSTYRAKNGFGGYSTEEHTADWDK